MKTYRSLILTLSIALSALVAYGVFFSMPSPKDVDAEDFKACLLPGGVAVHFTLYKACTRIADKLTCKNVTVEGYLYKAVELIPIYDIFNLDFA